MPATEPIIKSELEIKLNKLLYPNKPKPDSDAPPFKEVVLDEDDYKYLTNGHPYLDITNHVLACIFDYETKNLALPEELSIRTDNNNHLLVTGKSVFGDEIDIGFVGEHHRDAKELARYLIQRFNFDLEIYQYQEDNKIYGYIGIRYNNKDETKSHVFIANLAEEPKSPTDLVCNIITFGDKQIKEWVFASCFPKNNYDSTFQQIREQQAYQADQKLQKEYNNWEIMFNNLKRSTVEQIESAKEHLKRDTA